MISTSFNCELTLPVNGNHPINEREIWTKPMTEDNRFAVIFERSLNRDGIIGRLPDYGGYGMGGYQPMYGGYGGGMGYGLPGTGFASPYGYGFY
ncbi:unnamed protein product [Didymodactylos carnosus]|uniref:Uncharacterized protein n=1 Tax=Didymodactylos carnosus TaxID=1234261 RepID=A0A814PFE7_9BILA|nr:unnamed protein product [Didymodactylos carnosus]CAF3870126.1 unnamed protein product [Didymodactylos carnosus]